MLEWWINQDVTYYSLFHYEHSWCIPKWHSEINHWISHWCDCKCSQREINLLKHICIITCERHWKKSHLLILQFITQSCWRFHQDHDQSSKKNTDSRSTLSKDAIYCISDSISVFNNGINYSLLYFCIMSDLFSPCIGMLGQTTCVWSYSGSSYLVYGCIGDPV